MSRRNKEKRGDGMNTPGCIVSKDVNREGLGEGPQFPNVLGYMRKYTME